MLRQVKLRLGSVLLLAVIAGCQSPPEPQAEVVLRPSRIVSLAPHLTELAYAAGAGGQLVATVEHSDFPAAAAALPRIGDAFRVDYESLALHDPDLVLAWGSGTPREVTERLQSLGYRVVELEPGSIDAIATELLAIGELAGTLQSAQLSARHFRDRIADLKSQYATSDPVSVFFQISEQPLYTVSSQHVISQIIELCGGTNVFADLANIAPAVSVEAAVAARPQVILAASQQGDTEWQSFWAGWRQVPAVSAGHLYTIDRDLISRSGPRIIDGARQVCAALADARRDRD